MENEQETALIEKIKSGDQRALGNLYEKHRNEFAGWLRKNFGSHGDEAMDVYQETIMAFYENIVSGKLTELKSQAKTYLFSIGRNKYLEMMRKEGKTVSGEMQLHAVSDDSAEDLEQKRLKEDILELVERNFKKLTEKCQQILKFFYYQNFSMEKIAETMDYDTTNSAKTQKHKCMKRLRKMHHSN